MADEFIARFIQDTQPPFDAGEVQAFLPRQWRTKTSPARRTQHRILAKDGLAYIDLGDGIWTVIDETDIPLVGSMSWTARRQKGSRTYYVVALKRTKQESMLMHRRIVSPRQDEFIDHINSNGLDNRRENLRICTHTQNMWNKRITIQNTTGVKGVSFCTRTNRYIAQIVYKDKHVFLGRYDTIDEAADVYAKASKVFHGDFGRTD